MRCVNCGLIQNASPICKSCGVALGNPTSGEPTVPIFQKDTTKKQKIGGLILVALGVGLMIWDRGAVGLVGMAICGIGIAYYAKAMSIKRLKKESGHQLKDVLILLIGIIAAIGIPQSGFLSMNFVLQFAIVSIVGLILATLAGRRRATSGFAVFLLFVLPLSFWGTIWAHAMQNRRSYDFEVTSNIKNAAAAQELYFDKNNSYKSCVVCTHNDLPGYDYNPRVTLVAEVGRTGFVLTATHDNCKGEWAYQSITEKITGPDAIDSCKWP